MGFIRDIELFKQFLIWNVQTKPQAVRHYSLIAHFDKTKEFRRYDKSSYFLHEFWGEILIFHTMNVLTLFSTSVESYGELDIFVEEN
jgi:hypothetical protein